MPTLFGRRVQMLGKKFFNGGRFTITAFWLLYRAPPRSSSMLCKLSITEQGAEALVKDADGDLYWPPRRSPGRKAAP